MRTITKITTQKKKTSRYNIYLDNDYAFSVDEDVLIKFNLRKGLALTNEIINDINEDDVLQRAYLLAINYLSYRVRSIQEIRTYLRGKEMEQIVIEKVISRLTAENLLNDVAFSRAYVNDRMNLTTKGPQLIMRELQEKGVSADIARQAVAEYSYEQQFKTALKWANQEKNKKSKLSSRKRSEQLRNKMLQKGFTHDVVNAVMKELSFALSKEEEYSNLKLQADKLFKRYSKKHQGYELKMKIKAGLYNRGFSSEFIDEYIEKIVD